MNVNIGIWFAYYVNWNENSSQDTIDSSNPACDGHPCLIYEASQFISWAELTVGIISQKREIYKEFCFHSNRQPRLSSFAVITKIQPRSSKYTISSSLEGYNHWLMPVPCSDLRISKIHHTSRHDLPVLTSVVCSAWYKGLLGSAGCRSEASDRLALQHQNQTEGGMDR